MTNREIAEIFSSIGDIMDILGENRFKVLAYRRAAENIMSLGQDLRSFWRAGTLQEIPGIGQAIAEKIDELLTTGRLDFYERLQEQVPAGVVSLLQIPDVGPKTAKLLWEELGVQSVAELEAAARTGRLRTLRGLGARSEAKILAGIEILNRRSDRISLGTAWPVAADLLEGLRTTCSEAQEVAVAGSLRRMRATIGDIDLLAASKAPAAVMRAFVALPAVAEVILSGPTKTSVRLHNGLQADLRVLEPDRWGTALQYFSGSQAHNVRLRELAVKQGLSLSEYSFKREDGGEILCRDEAQVYETLGLPWIPPELREDQGEIQAALAGELPDLVEREAIRGDLHVHTDWSDGTSTLAEMAEAARELGYEYLVISDHSQSLGIARGLTAERQREQRAEIDALNERWNDFRLLQGCELEIKADGNLDLPDDVLARLDLVVASLHTSQRQDREQITRRMLNAVTNPYVDVIGHPSGRILGQREESAVDLDAVIDAAATTGTALEVNSTPSRLDLDDVHVRRAIRLGVKIAINSDAHHPDGLDNLAYGVATARRGWATAAEILNTMTLDELLAWKGARRARQG
ncbi:MAG: DNA polymerase/3'-5' exonuclease PolX [Anaerolineae bacterium]|nr:DNA polymerase/3'-5' exonuclease PolX [Anaerolineae bacterium]MDX9832210.1 DNA polymerase/3'-5' exonuclease PolX [Anaerolineae bacterium]